MQMCINDVRGRGRLFEYNGKLYRSPKALAEEYGLPWNSLAHYIQRCKTVEEAVDRCKEALYEELFEVICEIVCVKRTTVKVAGEDYPYELVKSKFLKLDSGHLEYVMGCMKNTTTKIANIKSYMVTALYNAPSTINHYYQQEVQHDMYGGGWHEKGIV